MQTLVKNQSQATAPPEKVRLRWDILFKDLGLLLSLMLARFIVWRTLRRRRQERAARRKQLKLVRGGNRQADRSVVAS